MTTLTNDVLRITIHKNHICFIDDTLSIRIITNRITESYPQYDNIIPKSLNNVASVSFVRLISSIKRLLIYANQISRQIQFTFEKSVLTLEAKELNVGNNAIEKIECTYDGVEPLIVTVNGRLLLDLIQNIDSATLIMKFSDVDEEHKSNNATIILPNEVKEGESILSLIMPIRI
jgi:DNA polymerase-3 subunit beta